MKRTGKEPHLFYKLIKLQISINTPQPSVLLDFADDFDPIDDPNEIHKIKHPTKKGNYRITVRADPKFKYNLTHECSLLYEAPRGLIKKYEFEPISSLAGELRLFKEHHSTHGEYDERRLMREIELSTIEDSVSLPQYPGYRALNTHFRLQTPHLMPLFTLGAVSGKLQALR